MAGIIKAGLSLVAGLIITGCVSTSTSVLDKKKDLVKAEETYVQIGYSHVQEQNFPSAKLAFERALELNSSSAGALMGLGIIYAREDEPALAEKKFSLAIKNDPTQEARFQYAIWKYNLGDYQKAYSEMSRVAKDTSYLKRANAHDIVGLLEMRMNKFDDAIVSFRKAITLNRQMVPSYINLANAYMRTDDPVMAYDAYNGFIKLVQIDLASQGPGTLWLGSQLSFLNNDMNASFSYGMQLKELFPDSTEAKLYLEWKESR